MYQDVRFFDRALQLFAVAGDSTSMDVATVFHGARFLKYNVSLLGYGFYGDCILDSEANRWMGPKRYDWEGSEVLHVNMSVCVCVFYRVSLQYTSICLHICAFIVLFLFCLYFCILCLIFFTVPLVRS